MRIGIGAQPFRALTDIFQVIAYYPPVTVDENFEKTAIGLCALDESTLHVIHGNDVDDLSKGLIDYFFPVNIATLSE